MMLGGTCSSGSGSSANTSADRLSSSVRSSSPTTAVSFCVDRAVSGAGLNHALGASLNGVDAAIAPA
eukprot:6454249-Prymnesium_polylepis.1